MYVFVSYARENAPLAQRLNAALNSAGFDTSLDTEAPAPGHKHNAYIKSTVDRADAFIFLANQHSVTPGSDTLTELSYAKAKWRNPAGYVLPVMTSDFDPGALPAYIRPTSAVLVRDNLEAKVVGWVQNRATNGGEGLTEHLEQFTRLSLPPPQLASGRALNSSTRILMGGILALLIVGAFGLVDIVQMGVSPAFLLVLLPFVAIGVVLIIVGALLTLIGHDRPVRLVAAIVVDQVSKDDGIILPPEEGARLSRAPVTKTARDVYESGIG